MNDSINLTLNETVQGAGNLTVGAVGQVKDAFNQGITDMLAGSINWAITALNLNFSISGGDIQLILFIALILLFWSKISLILNLFKTYGAAIIGLVVVFVALKAFHIL